ncbi:MASE1 domain-containing protein [bacterium]|nr:MASE1 domain-containing protein [bacterium]
MARTWSVDSTSVNLRPRLSDVRRILLVAGVYATLGWLGLKIDPVSELATLIWPASGWALAVLLWGGLRLWPGVALGALTVDALSGAKLVALPGIVIGNTLEALLAAYFMLRLGFRLRMGRVLDILLLFSVGVALSPLVASTLGTFSLWLAGTISSHGVFMTWSTWYLGDAVGVLVATPLLLVWAQRENFEVFAGWQRVFEATTLALCVVIVSVFAYFRMTSDTQPMLHFLLRPYTLFPFLVWAGLRFGMMGATMAMAGIAAVSLCSVLIGPGPLVRAPLRSNLIFTQYFIGFAAFTTYVLTAAAQAQKSAQRALRRAKESADAANTAKTAFVANMSHEIRTPLSIILGYCDFLLKPELGPNERHEYAQTIKRSGEALHKLVGDILDISKIEAGRLQVEKTGFPLEEFLEELNLLFRLKAEEKGIGLYFSRAENCELVVSDMARLRQILVNVIGNALKFTQAGWVRVEAASVSGLGQEPMLQFTVSDTGCGIPTHQVHKLFDRFEQGDTSTARLYGGSGLGLGLSKSLAQLLGGDLVLKESVPGRGSVFAITVTNSALLSAPIARRKTPALSPLPSLDKVRILLAEDAPDNRLLATRLLESAGASVDTAENGAVAVNKALSRNYDVVLMDLQMPGLDGYEATHFLRANRFARPIIALTADAFSDSRERCLHSGFSAHLTKPINPRLLLQTIQTCMSRAS